MGMMEGESTTHLQRCGLVGTGTGKNGLSLACWLVLHPGELAAGTAATAVNLASRLLEVPAATDPAVLLRCSQHGLPRYVHVGATAAAYLAIAVRSVGTCHHKAAAM